MPELNFRQVHLCAYFLQFIVEFRQGLAYHIGIAANVHVISIAIPPRNDMNMHMIRQPCACASAKIHSDIKTLRLYRLFQSRLTVSCQFGQFQKLLVTGVVKIADMSYRCDQKMSVVIGELIECDNAMIRSPQHKVFAVVIGSFDIITDEAVAIFK